MICNNSLIILAFDNTTYILNLEVKKELKIIYNFITKVYQIICNIKISICFCNSLYAFCNFK